MPTATPPKLPACAFRFSIFWFPGFLFLLFVVRFLLPSSLLLVLVGVSLQVWPLSRIPDRPSIGFTIFFVVLGWAFLQQ
jgi:hypothetical protein